MDEIVDMKLEELKQRPEGMWLSMMGVEGHSLKPMIKPFILGMSSDIAPLVSDPTSMKIRVRWLTSKVKILKNYKVGGAGTQLLDTKLIQTEIESLLATKMEQLKPQQVKDLLESVMRRHLGWLVVWGNIFGGLIGLVTKAIDVELEVFSSSEFRF
jgi:hypothetical protein